MGWKDHDFNQDLKFSALNGIQTVLQKHQGPEPLLFPQCIVNVLFLFIVASLHDWVHVLQGKIQKEFEQLQM